MGQKHGMDQGSRECADLEICIDSSLVVSFLWPVSSSWYRGNDLEEFCGTDLELLHFDCWSQYLNIVMCSHKSHLDQRLEAVGVVKIRMQPRIRYCCLWSWLTVGSGNKDTELEKPTNQQSENLGSSFGSSLNLNERTQWFPRMHPTMTGYNSTYFIPLPQSSRILICQMRRPHFLFLGDTIHPLKISLCPFSCWLQLLVCWLLQFSILVPRSYGQSTS